MKASKDDLDNWLNDDEDDDSEDDYEIKEPKELAKESKESKSKSGSKKALVLEKGLIRSIPTTDDFFAEFGV